MQAATSGSTYKLKTGFTIFRNIPQHPLVTAMATSLLCPSGTQTCARTLFRCRDIDIKPHDLDTWSWPIYSKDVSTALKMKFIGQAVQKLWLELNKKKRKLFSRSKVKVECLQLSTTSSVHHGTYSYQVTINFWQAVFEVFCGQTHRHCQKQCMLPG